MDMVRPSSPSQTIFKLVLPWIVAVICFVAFGASSSEVHRLKTRIGAVSRHVVHDHADVRRFMIAAKLAETDQPVVVYGDSITEMAELPRQLCGRTVVNAGIGGMASWEAAQMASRLFERQPFLIALAFGANDVGSSAIEQNYSELIRTAKRLSPRVISISDTADLATESAIGRAAVAAELLYTNPAIPPALKMADGIHYTAAAYRIWLAALEAAITRQCE
jgi:lysophospholipase L1-like esterase